MSDWNSRGKDDAPANTVQRIKAIIDKLNIGVPNETFFNQFDHFYSVQIDLGCASANGKGVSKALALASGYAELMERLQNKRLSTMLPWFDEYYYNRVQKHICTSSLVGTSKYVDELILKLVNSAIEVWEGFNTAQEKVLELVREYGTENQYVLLPFRSLKTKREEYLPVDFLQLFTGTNGMAAGNTIEEAIVQGTCEILERYAAIEILTKRLTPPEIPKQFLGKDNNTATIIAEIEKNDKYRIAVYDASLGKNIPCVMCVIHNLEVQTVGVKFGAYPNMSIAIERCFTEALQGQSLDSFSTSGRLFFGKHTRASWSNIHNILKVSYGSYPADIFFGKPDWMFESWQFNNSSRNSDRVEALEKILESLGSELFILDNSFLGFPAVYLYAPGVSEISPVDYLWLQEATLNKKVQQIFTHLSDLSKTDLESLKLYALLKRKSYLDNTLSQIAKNLNIYYKHDVKNEMAFLASLCAYQLNDLPESIEILRVMQHTPYTNGVFVYLSAKSNGLSQTESETLLKKMLPADVAVNILEDFSVNTDVINRVINYCSYKCGNCSKDCPQKNVSNVYTKLLNEEISYR